MNRNKRRTGLVILCIVTIWSYITGVRFAGELEEQNRYVSLVGLTAEDALGPKRAHQIQQENEKKDIPEIFTLWGQEKKAPVIAKELGKNEEADIIAVCGRTDLLFPQTAVLNTASRAQCLISSELGIRLFGGKDVVGLTARYNDRDYEIVGIVESKEIFFTYVPNEEEVVTLNRVTIKRKGGDSIKATASNYTGQYGEGEIINYDISGNIVAGLTLLIPIMSGLLLIMTVRKYIVESKGNRVELLIWCIVFIISFIIFSLMIYRHVKIPSDMIPTKWSDFEFWTDVCKEKKKAISIIISVAKKIPDLAYLAVFGKAVRCLIIATIGYITISLFLIKKSSK